MEEKLPPRKHHLRLTTEQRDWVQSVADDEIASDQRRNRASLLLLVDEGERGPGIGPVEAARQVGVTYHTSTIVIRRASEEGIETAVLGKHRGGMPGNQGGVSRTLNPTQEKMVQDLHGTERDDGTPWTYDQLAEKFNVSHGTIGNTLQRRERERK